MLSHLVLKLGLGDDFMRDFILLISVIAYMIGGYFFVIKAERFFYENLKNYDNTENENKPLNKTEK